jgi:hypothetical protein
VLDNPAALAAAVRTLLNDYADRTYRASPRVATSVVDNLFRTPAPVLRAIVSALREPVRAQAQAALPALTAVWNGKSREERRIAAELLGYAAPVVPAAVLALMDTWVLQIESGETADALAEHGLGSLSRLDPQAYLEHAARWIRHPKRWPRRFALSLFWPLLKDKQWDNVPGALAILRPVMTESDGEVRRAVATVLEHLAPKSPLEVGRFLREQAASSNIHTHWIVRNALNGLGPEQQAEIVKALRSFH